MGILRQLREFFDAGNHPTSDEYHADDPRAVAALRKDYHALVYERRQIALERDCYKAELIRGGLSEKNLAAMVKMYDRALRARVKAS